MGKTEGVTNGVTNDPTPLVRRRRHVAIVARASAFGVDSQLAGSKSNNQEIAVSKSITIIDVAIKLAGETCMKGPGRQRRLANPRS